VDQGVQSAGGAGSPMRQAKWWKNGLSYSRPADPERQILLPVLRPQAFPPLQMQRPYSITGPREAQADSRMLENGQGSLVVLLLAERAR